MAAGVCRSAGREYSLLSLTGFDEKMFSKACSAAAGKADSIIHNDGRRARAKRQLRGLRSTDPSCRIPHLEMN